MKIGRSRELEGPAHVRMRTHMYIRIHMRGALDIPNIN